MSEKKEVWVDSKGNITILYCKHSAEEIEHGFFRINKNYFTEFLDEQGFHCIHKSQLGYRYATNGREPYEAIKIGVL